MIRTDLFRLRSGVLETSVSARKPLRTLFDARELSTPGLVRVAAAKLRRSEKNEDSRVSRASKLDQYLPTVQNPHNAEPKQNIQNREGEGSIYGAEIIR